MFPVEIILSPAYSRYEADVSVVVRIHLLQNLLGMTGSLTRNSPYHTKNSLEFIHTLICLCNKMADDMVSFNMHSVFCTGPIREALCFLSWHAKEDIMHTFNMEHHIHMHTKMPSTKSWFKDHVTSARWKRLSSIPTWTWRMALSSSHHRNLSFTPWRNRGSHPEDTKP